MTTRELLELIVPASPAATVGGACRPISAVTEVFGLFGPKNWADPVLVPAKNHTASVATIIWTRPAGFIRKKSGGYIEDRPPCGNQNISPPRQRGVVNSAVHPRPCPTSSNEREYGGEEEDDMPL